MLRSDRLTALTTVVVFLVLSSCGGEKEQSPADPPGPTTAANVSEIFVDVAESAGLTFVHFNGVSGEHYFNGMMGGGAALFDYDNDGDTDVVVVNNNGPVRLLLNPVGQDRPWVGLRAVGKDRDMLGAEVVSRSQGPSLWRRVHTDGSYVSASDSARAGWPRGGGRR